MMSRTEMPCPVCGSAERELLFSKQNWNVYKCDSCGLGILDPRPSDSELTALYQHSYFASHYDEGLVPGTAAMQKRLSQENHRIRFFSPLKKQGRVLDIGCGRGYFLLACRERGYDVRGYDVSEDGAAYIRDTLGIPVTTGKLEDAFEKGSFDVITMWHSLEHTPNPAKYLEAAGRWLRSDGVLVIEVPNYAGTDARLKGSAWEDWDLPFHLLHFTPKALELLLVNQGFSIVRRKSYHSSVIKDRLSNIPFIGLFARPVAKLFSGSGYAVVAIKSKPGTVL
jgi:2-polyprenyl-3-methyl-5-hydroxy-6-metoxy-1,4-benzoquinol methylase